MKINDITKAYINKRVNHTNEEMGQGVITNYQPGKSVAVTMPDGTQIQKDLTKDPTAITKDANGNPIFNLAGHQTPSTATPQTAQQQFAPGTHIAINTDPNATTGVTMGTEETAMEEDGELENELGSPRIHKSAELSAIKRLSGI
jgi:hypothetical protein